MPFVSGPLQGHPDRGCQQHRVRPSGRTRCCVVRAL